MFYVLPFCCCAAVAMSLEWEILHPELYISWKIFACQESIKSVIFYALLYKLLNGMQLLKGR